MHHGDCQVAIASRGARGTRNRHRSNHCLWSRSQQVASDPRAPDTVGHKAQIPALRGLEEVKTESGFDPSSYFRMRGEFGTRDGGHVSNLHRRKQSAHFEVEMPSPHNVIVISEFGNDVRACVRGAGVVGCVKLVSQDSIESSWENHLRALPCELLRVFDAHGPYKMIVKVIAGPELGSAGEVVTYLMIAVLVECGEHIRGIRSDSNAVGCEHAPGLTAHELPLTALQVQPIVAETIGVAVRSHKHIRRIIAVEIKFNEASNVIFAELGMGLQVEAGGLSRGAEIRGMARRGDCGTEWPQDCDPPACPLGGGGK